jgi:hypothetical protein
MTKIPKNSEDILLVQIKIWNVDERGIRTVVRQKKLLAGRGVRRVGTATSAERGDLITVAVAVSTKGTFIPSLNFTLPKKIFS